MFVDIPEDHIREKETPITTERKPRSWLKSGDIAPGLAHDFH
jgi:hypothetical protein